MADYECAKDFWEDKIIPWEESRYSSLGALSPLSWTVRKRLQKAIQMVQSRVNSNGRILELACGSGHLAEQIQESCSHYLGIDIASTAIQEARSRVPDSRFEFKTGDVLDVAWGAADLTIFLGLTDWLNPKDLFRLFDRLESPEILFSYTQAGVFNPYRIYRKIMDSADEQRFDHAKMYSTKFILELLNRHGYRTQVLCPPTLANPGALVWATRFNETPGSGQ